MLIDVFGSVASKINVALPRVDPNGGAWRRYRHSFCNGGNRASRRSGVLMATAAVMAAVCDAGAQTLNGRSAEPGASVDAIRWLSELMTGGIATAIAIVAVSGLAIVMLQGRLPARRGSAVLTGCFILFSSPAIAAGLLAALGRGAEGAAITVTGLSPDYTAPAVQPVPYDPYAGASVPARAQDGARDLLPE